MACTIQVDITIRSDKVSEFLEIINDDRETALKSDCILSFDIVTDKCSPNKFTLIESVTSKEDLLVHMRNTHYV